MSSGFLKHFYQSFFILKGNDDMHKGLNEFGQIGSWTTELAALERLK